MILRLVMRSVFSWGNVEMGLKHILLVESALKKRSMSKNELREFTLMNYNILLGVLDYLLYSRKIKKKTVKGKILYEWRK
jgi:hypothetical protein